MPVHRRPSGSLGLVQSAEELVVDQIGVGRGRTPLVKIRIRLDLEIHIQIWSRLRKVFRKKHFCIYR